MSLFAQILSFDFFNLFSLVPGTERDGSNRAGPLDWWDSGVAQNSLSISVVPRQEGHILRFSFPPPLSRQHRQGSDLVLPAGPVAIARLCQQGRGLPGKSQGSGMRAEVKPGCQVSPAGFQICRDVARNWCSSSEGLSSLVPGQTTWVRAGLSTVRSGWGTAQSIFWEPLLITLQTSASGAHLYFHSPPPPTSLHRRKGRAGQQMVC